MPAAEGFVPLALWLRGPVSEAAPEAIAVVPEASPVAVPAAALPAPAVPAAVPADAAAVDEALRDVRLFRARLADAFDAAVVRLVRELAYAVIGRELSLAPADLAAIGRRILAEHPAATPVAIRHAPGDAPDLPLPACADPTLAPGDLVVTFVEGTVDARLGVRIDVALEAWS